MGLAQDQGVVEGIRRLNMVFVNIIGYIIGF